MHKLENFACIDAAILVLIGTSAQTSFQKYGEKAVVVLGFLGSFICAGRQEQHHILIVIIGRLSSACPHLSSIAGIGNDDFATCLASFQHFENVLIAECIAPSNAPCVASALVKMVVAAFFVA